MREIKLTQGKVALVDDEDFDLLNGCKWYANRIGNTMYAYRGLGPHGDQKHFAIHQALLGQSLRGLEIDHIDGNGLNNQRSNLRMVTHHENQRNRHEVTTSKYLGVSHRRTSARWQAQIHYRGRSRWIGNFKEEIDAHADYEVARKFLITSGGD